MAKSKRLSSIGRSFLKLTVSTLAVTSIATTILAQPVDSPTTPTPVAPGVTVVPQSEDEPNWGLIGVILTGTGGIIATLLQGRNSSMSLQVDNLKAQQEAVANERKMLQAQTLEQIAGLKQELREEKELRKSMDARLEKFEDEGATLTRENLRLEAKCSLLEVENANLKAALDRLTRSNNQDAPKN